METITVPADEFYEQRAKIARLEQEATELASDLALAQHELAHAKATLSLQDQRSSTQCGKAEAENPANTADQVESGADTAATALSPASSAVPVQFTPPTTARPSDLAAAVNGKETLAVNRGQRHFHLNASSHAGASSSLGAVHTTQFDEVPKFAPVTFTTTEGASQYASATATAVAGGVPTPLDSSFDQKDMIKSLGGEWDPDGKKWQVPAGVDLAPFAAYLPSARKYLNTAFSDKEKVKQLGGRWNAEASKWYVPGWLDKGPFAQWMPAALAPAAAPPIEEPATDGDATEAPPEESAPAAAQEE